MTSKLPISVRIRIKEYNVRQRGDKKLRPTECKGIVYIAGKVGDLTDDVCYYEVVRKFARRERELRKLGYRVANPMTLVKRGTEWHVAMRKCIAKLVICDFISPLPDWKFSPGATIELQLAEKLNITKIYPSKINSRQYKLSRYEKE